MEIRQLLASYFAAQKPVMQSSGIKHAGIKEGKVIFNQGEPGIPPRQIGGLYPLITCVWRAIS